MSIQKASKNEVRKEIADLINRIKEQSDRIGMQREIPQSELDLILHRIEELHRKTVVWSYLNELPEEVPGFPFPATGEKVSGSQLPVAEEKVSGFQLPVSGAEKKPAEEKVIPPAENKITPEVVTPKPIVPEPISANPEPETENLKQETGNLVRSEPDGKKQETVNGKQEPENRKPLKDVKSFIGFNEKLMYIRQVFKGDSAAYDAAIAQFNSMESWDEAQSFLSVLAGEYSWSKHDEPVEIFTQTVKRRFS